MPFGTFRLNTLAKAAAAVSNSITATGGNVGFVNVSGTYYKYHNFTTTGNNSFVVSSVTGTPTVEIVVVGGGGGEGGSNYTGNPTATGGGGAGQVTTATGISVTAQTYTITVGAGGAVGTSTQRGGTGGTSSAFGYSAIGGGGGGNSTAGTGGAALLPGVNGGSAGGGGGAVAGPSYSGTGGTGTFGGSSADTTAAYSGGGGGSTGAGQAGSGTSPANGRGGAGGAGTVSTFLGSSVTLATGGNGIGAVGTLNPVTGASYGYGANGSYRSNGLIGSGVNTGGQGVVWIRYPAEPVATLTNISVTTSTTTSITVPATVQAGDLLIYSSTARNTTTAIPTTPTMTGWSNTVNVALGTTLGIRQVVYYKVAVAGDASSTITNMSGTGATGTVLMVYRPDKAITSVSTNWGTGGQATDSAVTNQTLTMSGTYTGPFISIANYASTAAVLVRGSTTTATAESNPNTSFYVKRFEALNSSTTFSNSTISMADYGTNAMSAVTFKVY